MLIIHRSVVWIFIQRQDHVSPYEESGTNVQTQTPPPWSSGSCILCYCCIELFPLSRLVARRKPLLLIKLSNCGHPKIIFLLIKNLLVKTTFTTPPLKKKSIIRGHLHGKDFKKYTFLRPDDQAVRPKIEQACFKAGHSEFGRVFALVWNLYQYLLVIFLGCSLVRYGKSQGN